jgi:hypothetical protein
MAYRYPRRKNLTQLSVTWNFPNKVIGASFDIQPVSSKYLTCLSLLLDLPQNWGVISSNVPDTVVNCNFYNPSYVEPFDPNQSLFFTRVNEIDVEPITYICPSEFPAAKNTACRGKFIGQDGSGAIYYDGENYFEIEFTGEFTASQGSLTANYICYDFFYPYDPAGAGTLTITYQ